MARKNEPSAPCGAYTFTVHPAYRHHWPVVSIVDSGAERTWPEDVDPIFAELRAGGINLDAHRVIYGDYSGWYELDVGAEGTCKAFRPLDVRDEGDALATMRARDDHEAERLAAIAADFPPPEQAEILPFAPRERKP